MRSIEIPKTEMKPLKKTSLVNDLLVLSGLSIFLMAPLGRPGFFTSHDEAQLLWRITEFHANIVSGCPVARWFPDFARGFGLPFLEFFPVTFLYLAEIFKLTGLSTMTSAKLGIWVSTVLGGYFAYLLSLEYWNRRGALLSGILYIYAPYRIADLYIRGDVNEYTAMTLLPLNLWLIRKTIIDPSAIRWHILTSWGIALLIITHYPSTVIQLPVYAVFGMLVILSENVGRRRLLTLVIVFSVALVIASPWWATALFNRHLVQMEGMTQGFADYKDQFISPYQWISFYWNYGASVKGTGDTFPFQIGNAALILTAFGLPVWIRRLKPFRQPLSLWPFTFILLSSLFLMTRESILIWKLIPVLPMIQFPYRLLQIPALILSISAGSLGILVCQRLPELQRAFIPIASIAILMYSSTIGKPPGYLNLTEKDLTPQTIRKIAHTHCTNEFTPAAVGKRFPPFDPSGFSIEKIPDTGYSRREMEVKLDKWMARAANIVYWEGDSIRLGKIEVVPGSFQVINGNGSIRHLKKTPCRLLAIIENEQRISVRYAQFYFQGWVGMSDGIPLVLSPDPDTGLIRFELSPGIHHIELYYGNLPLFRILKWPSGLLFFLTVLLLIFKPGRQNAVRR